MYLDSYNSNIYIKCVIRALNELKKVNQFFEEMINQGKFYDVEEVINVYEKSFENSDCIDFKISRIFKSIIFAHKQMEYSKGNSFYHIRLLLKGDDITWLDDIYGNKLKRIIRLLKNTFGKIDNLTANFNEEKALKYKQILEEVTKETEKFIDSSFDREIIEQREKLKAEQLAKLPYGGLFYMASIKNIEGIISKGILSHNIAHEERLTKVDISNQQVNQRRNRNEPVFNRNIHDYAPLYINPKNPMQFVLHKRGLRESLVLIKVNPNILLKEDVIFSDGNAASYKTNFYSDIDDFNKLNWTCINDTYWVNYTDGKRFRCSEVLVHKQIQQYYFLEMFVYEEKLLNELIKLFPNHYGIKISINKKLFF